MPTDETPQPVQEDSTNRYGYYFERSRPVFVERVLERKHAAMLEAALGGRRAGVIVELGPGEGFVSRAARRHPGLRYLAIEAAPAGAALLRTQGFDVIEAVVPPFPEAMPAPDLIYASHLIEHLPGPDAVLAFLGESRARLAEGGRLALAFPDARHVGPLFWDCDYTHQWPSTPRRVAQAAFDSGFEVEQSIDFCGPLQGFAAHLLRVVMKLYPHRFLSAVDRSRADFWFRGRLLFVPDVLMVLRSRA